MGNSDTTLGGPQERFPSTLWTHLVHSRDDDAEARRAAWESLAALYWKPIYTYIRLKWSKSNDDAKDFTQDFFAWMMEHEFPGRANPRRGRFRVFVRAALDNYLKQEERNRHRIKRGGGRGVVALDRQTWEPPDSRGETADQMLSRVWKEELMTRATTLLRDGYRARNKETHFLLFQDYYLSEGTPPTHQELAAKYAINVTDVNHYLVDVKARFRDLLRELVAETVDSAAELDEEFRELFGQGPR